jgi:hypothetical protein
MEKAIVEGLADAVIQQYREMPLAVSRVELDRDKLVKVLNRARGFQHKKRMQFNIAGFEKFNSFHKYGGHDNKLVAGSFCPRRVFANYTTDYIPTDFEKGRQELQEEEFEEGTEPNDYAQVICRFMRQDKKIADIRKRSLDAGHKYGVMVQLDEELPIVAGPPHYGGDLKVSIPLFFIPGASKEDLDTLARFSIKMQKPVQRDIASCVSNYVFDKRLYE